MFFLVSNSLIFFNAFKNNILSNIVEMSKFLYLRRKYSLLIFYTCNAKVPRFLQNGANYKKHSLLIRRKMKWNINFSIYTFSVAWLVKRSITLIMLHLVHRK